jgi:signal transduction histidine kinase
MRTCRRRDTIAWRIGAIIAAVIAITSGVIALFMNFGGVWAKAPIDLRTLLDGISVVVQLVDAAPAADRPRLVMASKTENYRLRWYGEARDVAWFNAAEKRATMPKDDSFITMLDAELHRPRILIGPSHSIAAGANTPLGISPDSDIHYLAIGLTDGSWLVFEGNSRNWGLSPEARIVLKLIGFLLVSAAICALATIQISQPIRRFAREVHAAGVNTNNPPIKEIGPLELRELIAAFNGMQAKIAAFVAYRTTMLAAISHDLRTPLTRMRLRGEYIADPVQRERLFADVHEMQTMIDGALAFFRGDGDEEPVRAFDLSGVLQTIADDFSDQGIEVGYVEHDHVVYAGRATAIKRAITNLVENAVKYGSAPAMSLARENNRVVVKVRDLGPGIPQEALEEVFEPFFRLDKSRHKARGGVGLGLTAARSILRNHGGDLVLRNHPDGGLEAEASLPLVEASA